MALSPHQLNAWTPEDETQVSIMEVYADSLLAHKKAPFSNGEYRIVFPQNIFGKALGPNPNRRLAALIQRYKDAKWGEVDGGIMGDGSAVLTLREHKRYYSNPF